MKRFLPFGVLLLLTGVLSAQQTGGDKADIQPFFLIETPVAGLLPRSTGAAEIYVYPEGGMLFGVFYGLLPELNVGLSYGGTNLLGSGGITWNNLPGLMVRYRLLEEDDFIPALLAGLDTQGKDGYHDEWKQYAVKSPGIFLAASKNFKLYGHISFHTALTYTLERQDGDKSPNLLLGMEKSIGSQISFLAEYNFMFDSDNDKLGFWNGMMNIGARLSTTFGLNVDIYFKNLLTNQYYFPKVFRSVNIQYIRRF